MSTKEKEIDNVFNYKDIIHVVSEIVIVIGITFYFSSKNRKMMSTIEELGKKIEEQDKMIQALKNSIQQIGNSLGQMNQKVQAHDNGLNMLVEKMNGMGSKKISKPIIQGRHVKPILKEEKPVRVSKIQFKKPEEPINKVENFDIEEEFDESDLDEELSQELAELHEDSSLKKEV